MRDRVDSILRDILIFSVRMDLPSNYDDILDFICNDIKETADIENWHSGDVIIAFRRFIERSND